MRPLALFNGCRLALARRRPSLAGRWEDVARNEASNGRPSAVRSAVSHFRRLCPMVGESISLNVWAIRDAGYLFAPVALVSQRYGRSDRVRM